MKNLILSTTALIMISGSAAFALTDLSTASIVSEFSNAQKIDITRGTFRTKVEVVINGVKTEIVYDNATKSEIKRVATPMTAAEIEANEVQLGIDINGDGVIGAPAGNGGLISPVNGDGTGSLIAPVDGYDNSYGLDNSYGDDDDDGNDDDDDRRGSNRHSGSRHNDSNHSGGRDNDHGNGADNDHGNGHDNDDYGHDDDD